MSPRMPVPVEIGSIVGKTLRLTWSDGHRSTISWKALRAACPCANCRGEWADGRTVDPSSIREDIHPMRIDRVGAYALQPTWWDGHNTGLYPFPLLRFELCECADCTAQRSGQVAQ